MKVSSAALLLLAYFCFSFNPAFSQNLVEGETYSTGDIISSDPNAWDGCYTLNQGWGGTRGGSCPTINDKDGGQINFGYVNRTLTNTAAIDQALKNAGLETTGYTYSWQVKNADANYTQGNGRGKADPFEVTVKIYDESGRSVYEKSYDYSYWMNWTSFSGTETFDEPFNLDEISELQLSVTGYDIGYWAGYYGPEFRKPNINLLYRVAGNPLEEESLEDQTILNAQCSSDPTFSPECPGYNDAILAQMTATTPSTTSQDSFSTSTGTPETTGGTTNDMATESTQSTGMDPVAEATAAPVQEVQAATSVVAETTATAVEPTATGTDQTTSQRSAGPGLNANQLSALNAANNAANAAIGIAGESSTASQSSTNSSSGSSTGTGSSGGSSDGGSSLSADGQDDGSSSDSTGSTGGVDLASSGLSGQDQSLAEGGAVEEASMSGDFASSDFIVASLTTDLIKDIINSISEKTLQDIKDEQKEDMEEQNAESIEEANKKEDELVQAAKEGSKDEDAQAALLGYNPSFRAYQQPQMSDSEFYKDKEIYAEQRTYDNPNARLFNGASDAKHRDMVRQQYGY